MSELAVENVGIGCQQKNMENMFLSKSAFFTFIFTKQMWVKIVLLSTF